MIVAKIANSHNDEYYTPAYAVVPMVKYVPKGSKIWCPFDTNESHVVKVLRDSGHEVRCTHIGHGEDFNFFNLVPFEGEYIISNPPYSLKNEVFKRLFELGAPFAMLVGVVGLSESQARYEMFRDNKFEVMYLNRRIGFFKDFADQKPSISPPFSSVWICSGMLPRQIIFEEVNK